MDEYLGSIEGTLHAAYLGGEFYYYLRDQLSGKPVRCYFKETQTLKARAALEKRVIVSGRIKAGPNGERKQITVETVTAMEPSEGLPSWQDVRGLLR